MSEQFKSMENLGGWVKLHRSIKDKPWFTKPCTLMVYVYLLLNANVAQTDYCGVRLERGQLAISYTGLARDLQLSIQQVRTAFAHLKATEDVTTVQCRGFQLVELVNYNELQGLPTPRQQELQRVSRDNQQENQQSFYNKGNKKIKKKKNMKNDSYTVLNQVNTGLYPGVTYV